VTGKSRVCLAISSFRNDENVLALIEAALSAAYFDEILVVDSLGTGAMAQAIEERGWSKRVRYENHPKNLGSAGNLARRLELAAERGHDWVYAINHDGEVDASVVRELVACGRSLRRPGAVHPLRFKTGRGLYDMTGRSALPLPFRGRRTRPAQETLEVYWGSSNGTLYALEPVRQGLLPWADLWMGWEDLGYGWLLHKRGYQQVLLTTVETRDSYEYAHHRAFGRTLTITSKPAWYAYYQARNLILVTRRNGQAWDHWAVVAGRVLLELGVTAALRPNKTTRYRLLARGVFDGLRERTGKWLVP
jgi:GT2 family glycosyltransferase